MVQSKPENSRRYVTIIFVMLLLAILTGILLNYPTRSSEYQLNLARQRWEDSDIEDYSVTIFGFNAEVMPCQIHSTIRVEGGEIVEVFEHLPEEARAYEDPVAGRAPGCRSERFLVPAMHSEIERKLTFIHRTQIITASYNFEHGYVKSFTHLSLLGECCGSVEFSEFKIYD